MSEEKNQTSLKVLVHLTQSAERWDTLSAHYYGDPMSYWRIIAANPQVPILPVLPAGIKLNIPVIEILEMNSKEELPPWLRQ